MKRRQFLSTAAGTGVASTAIIGTAAAQESEGGDPRQGSGTEDDPYIVEMHTEGSEYLFDPVGLYVEPGDTVRWVNASGAHSTASYSPENPRAEVSLIPEDAEPWNSGVFQEQGATFDYTFEAEGTYDYYCEPHKTLGMVARIVCGEPGGPAEENEIPDDVGAGVLPPSDTIVEDLALSYPYFPDTGAGSLPGLAIGGISLFALANAYLLSDYDISSGRYGEDAPDDTQTGRD
ncbi:plastocyanin/azurin family copper-binding protein [Halocalculus aciditolerans]|uniref:Blue (type 1) copper domain-containing protein n=1 Tax=Halocalculus aciditolerans TaxID=1383812 RepID=A0A830FMA1_9EURY|nr:plastocyanin/azurin family copper-binding protein [Halocalculus aciditolerans]GGL69792.1 hypothetical protein GCM10009039_29750 [Halocalculus aciditolerans]